MYYLREFSLNKHTQETPIFKKLEQDCIFQPDKLIALDFATTGIYERSITNWACETLMDPSKDFIDIGAHVGTWTIPFAKKANKVHSFECCPRTYNFLCANMALNKLDYKVKTYNTALGGETGFSSYFIRTEDGGGNGCMKFDYDPKKQSQEITVPITTLDSFNLSNIGFIKIDVEGFELNVLRGAIETLKRNNYPKFIFESWRPQRESEGVPAIKLRDELFKFLDEIGYMIISINGWDEIFLAEFKHP
jgi:FkbM family methyltransferase